MLVSLVLTALRGWAQLVFLPFFLVFSPLRELLQILASVRWPRSAVWRLRLAWEEFYRYPPPFWWIPSFSFAGLTRIWSRSIGRLLAISCLHNPQKVHWTLPRSLPPAFCSLFYESLCCAQKTPRWSFCLFLLSYFKSRNCVPFIINNNKMKNNKKPRNEAFIT